MARERYDFVLEDDLYLEYHNFMNASGRHELHIVKRILSFYKRNILTNVSQLRRLDLLNNKGSLESQLRAAGYTTSGTFVCEESREKAKAHMNALCGSAQKRIHILDKYLLSDSNLEWLCSMLPRRKIRLILPDDSNFNEIVVRMKRLGIQCEICKDSGMMVHRHHDRYMVIDDSLEIILSGGFDHLVRKQKDFTYLIREIDKNHLVK